MIFLYTCFKEFRMLQYNKGGGDDEKTTCIKYIFDFFHIFTYFFVYENLAGSLREFCAERQD